MADFDDSPLFNGVVGGAGTAPSAVPADDWRRPPVSPLNMVKSLYDGLVSAATLPGDVYTGKIDPMSQEGIERTVNMAGTLAGGGLPMAEKGAVGIFGGRLAETANPALFGLADKALAGGIDDARLLKASGLFAGVDGKLRFEIPDAAANYTPLAKPPAQVETSGMLAGTNTATATGTVGQVLDHPQLFSAYPDLAHIPVVAADLGEGRLGSFDGETLNINSELPVAKQREVVLHELQHAVQERENFARGGNNADSGFGAAADERMTAYRALAGEVEARNVQARSQMTPSQLAEIPPWATQDTPNINQNPTFYVTNGMGGGEVPRLADGRPMSALEATAFTHGHYVPGAPLVEGLDGTGFYYPRYPNVMSANRSFDVPLTSPDHPANILARQQK